MRLFARTDFFFSVAARICFLELGDLLLPEFAPWSLPEQFFRTPFIPTVSAVSFPPFPLTLFAVQFTSPPSVLALCGTTCFLSSRHFFFFYPTVSPAASLTTLFCFICHILIFPSPSPAPFPVTNPPPPCRPPDPGALAVNQSPLFFVRLPV